VRGADVIPYLSSLPQETTSSLPQETTEARISTGSCTDEPLGLIMGSEEQALTRHLRRHVEQLASQIGERNVFCPTALQAAASNIEHEWEQQGYAVRQLAYNVSGIRCLNLEVTRHGGARQREILLIGAHYDTVPGCPGANDNAGGVSAILELSRLFASIKPALTVRFVTFVNEELHDSPAGERDVRRGGPPARR
jgi:acetylornithine deacetylase/succinyl-diaminopimelate desuccinylase-like protein